MAPSPELPSAAPRPAPEASAAAPVTVTVTGAGGRIGYALLFRIAAGDLLGPDRRVRPSFPVTSDGTGYAIVEGLALDDRARARIDASVAELVAERDAVRALEIL